MLIYKKYKKIINSILVILSILLILILYIKIKTISSIVNIIFIGFILAYALKPLRDTISEKFKLSKKISSISIILTIFLGLILLSYIVIPSIIRESYNIGYILDNIDEYVKNIVYKLNLNDISFFESIYNQISEEVNIFFSKVTDNLLENLMVCFESLVSLAIVPIVTYYFLVDGDLIYNKLLLILPTEKRIIAKRVISHIDKVLSRYIISQLLLSLIIGALTFIVLVIIDVKFALILGIFNGILNIVPYFGPIIGGVPAIFVALMESPNKALWTLIAIFLIQQIEGNILSPKITGDSTNMHPIIIIILLLVGEKLGGLIGMIVAVPIGVIVKVIYDDINDYLF
ncbi:MULTISPECIES: AI-2E family transporter [Clostridium]|jgi:predicted PurR-regulated permease PerM|uniref:AI-2E family transporter n=1 Tax=Clostridium TaxID=1485 RepID=UPI000BE42CE1|nr:MULTISPECIES: AI-2E family transporter [Clostridium]MBU6135778.1 AI-2E family transporter [Clostridium tertium]MDB1932402.1 AI-2E family transporter [Clostridium tertium]MDB1937834.1 AI-2E family transporter [Clostridium tertium]MDB1968312.1 AI-2E family transporter [Clostridium tertium]MDU1277134.1 AI-2E family transporter [Clostridium sp.]